MCASDLGGGADPERRQRMMERIRQMSPEERQEFFARMRERRGAGDPGRAGGPGRGAGGPRRPTNVQQSPNVPAVERGASTIDALFAPIEVQETTGRVWVLDGGRLASLNVRLGVTDGTASELLRVMGPSAAGSGSPPPATAAPAAPEAIGAGLRLVTNVTTPDAGDPAVGNSGSPLIPQFPFGRRRR